jgi:hypothetical protein
MATFKKSGISAKLKRSRKPRAVKAPADYGVRGAPINSGHPFYFGFMATAGALIALTVLKALASASQVFVLIVISLFFAIGLNPAVNYFERRKIKRRILSWNCCRSCIDICRTVYLDRNSTIA